ALVRAARACARAWQTPAARLDDAQRLDGKRHAAIDVSDGLATECRTLARASDVCVELDEARLRASFDARLVTAAEGLARDPLEFALGGGEDYALLASGPARTRPKGAHVIGSVRAGRGAVIVGVHGTQELSSGY